MKDYLELLFSVGKLKKFQKNSILFYEGEEAKKFLFYSREKYAFIKVHQVIKKLLCIILILQIL